MGTNYYQSQLTGPFSTTDEIMNKIRENAAVKFSRVSHLGIQTDVRNFVIINGEEVEIGKTGIYEIGNTEITSIRFKQDVDKNTIIDYTIEIV